jgi:hypothetical protein
MEERKTRFGRTESGQRLVHTRNSSLVSSVQGLVSRAAWKLGAGGQGLERLMPGQFVDQQAQTNLSARPTQSISCEPRVHWRDLEV